MNTFNPPRLNSDRISTTFPAAAAQTVEPTGMAKSVPLWLKII